LAAAERDVAAAQIQDVNAQIPGRHDRAFAIARTSARKLLNPFTNTINACVRV
jgi:hypothetical protein